MLCNMYVVFYFSLSVLSPSFLPSSPRLPYSVMEGVSRSSVIAHNFHCHFGLWTHFVSLFLPSLPCFNFPGLPLSFSLFSFPVFASSPLFPRFSVIFQHHFYISHFADFYSIYLVTHIFPVISCFSMSFLHLPFH